MKPRKRAIRVPRTRGGETMTESHFWSMIRSALRQRSRWWKPVYICEQNARRKYKGPNKKQKYEYQCNLCKKWFPKKEVSIDHINPVGSLSSYDDLPGFVERLFVEQEGLQLLCNKCHSNKTKSENQKKKEMIEGTNTNQSESSYRELLTDSSSTIREFLKNRKRYHKKYILQQEVEEEESLAITVGNLVDCLLLEEDKFDSKFLISACASQSSPLMTGFIDALVDCTLEEDKNKTGASFSDLLKEAYAKSEFKISFPRVVTTFSGSDSEILYREKLESKKNNLTVVHAKDVDNASKIVESLRCDPFISPIINLISDIRFTVENQLQVEEFLIDNHPFKAMIDKVIIDHKKKTIRIYDIKCTWSVEGFLYEYYLKRRAYIQGYVYYRAMLSLTEEGKRFEGFKVHPPSFIVSDSIGYYKPLIYDMTDNNLVDAYEGFTYRYEYPGLKKAIIDLNWALDNDIWDISRENYLSKGRVEINIQNEKEQ